MPKPACPRSHVADAAAVLEQARVARVVVELLAQMGDMRVDGSIERFVAAPADDEDGVARAVEIGVVDEIIDPSKTRHIIARAIKTAPQHRGIHGNIPL